MTDCKKLVASRELCERLRTLGVAQVSFFHHFKNESVAESEFWDCGVLANPGDNVAAFTVAELDIMLGNRWDRPRLPRLNELTRCADPLVYVFHYLDKETRFESMADAYAGLVITLIEDEQLEVNHVNIRLRRIFPQFIS